MPRKPLPRTGLPWYSVNVRRILKDRDITHARFADMTKLSKNSMYSALNGGDVKVSTLQRMANALGVPLETIVSDHPAPKPQVETAPSGNMSPAIIGMLAGLMSGQQSQGQQLDAPTTAVEFLSFWKSLDARSMSALLSLAKSLAANREVEASYHQPVLKRANGK